MSDNSKTISGIHHVTAISGPPQENVDFYAGFLGLRFVKRTVNFDDPGTYHLYYGDYHGRPGSIMTFFPWSHASRGRVGSGMVGATSFAVDPDTMDEWVGRFADAGHDFGGPTERFGERVLGFYDADGLRLEIVGHSMEEDTAVVDAASGISGFHGVTLALADPVPTARLLTDVFGYVGKGEEAGRLRFESPVGERASVVDIVRATERGRSGVGTVHHVAFRASDDEEQLEWQEAVASFGLHVTEVKDRNYFRSIYFREPGGVLFEIATDPPGFTADEPVDELGSSLKLPPWLESQRNRIEGTLEPLVIPAVGAAQS